jgi:hypothetical protein
VTPDSRPEPLQACFALDPSDKWRCVLPLAHDGPHGWETTDRGDDVQRDYRIIIVAQRETIERLREALEHAMDADCRTCGVAMKHHNGFMEALLNVPSQETK